MAGISPLGVAALAYAAGFRGDKELVEAVAVAKQESGFNTKSSNSCCVGLWQINLKAHGETKERMVQPDLNAKKAYQIYKAAGGWCTRGSVAKHSCNPWQGYGANQPGSLWQTAMNVGAKAVARLYAKMAQGESAEEIASKEYSGGVLDGITQVPGELLDKVVPDVGSSITNAFKAIIEFWNRIGKWISNPENWVRVLKVIGGVVTIVVGGAIVAKDPVLKNAMNVVPTGKILKAVKK